MLGDRTLIKTGSIGVVVAAISATNVDAIAAASANAGYPARLVAN